MNRAWLVLVGLALLSLCCAPAFADEIGLLQAGSKTNPSVIFTGTGGGGFTVAFNTLAHGVAAGTGVLNAPSNSVYSINQNGATVSTNGMSCGTGCYGLSSTGPVVFNYGTNCSTNGPSCWLTGNLFLVNVTQSTQTKGGIFNDSLLINFTATGGQMLSQFGTNGVVTFTLSFQTTQSLATLIKNGTLGAYITSGAVFPASEPATLPLLGATLLAFVGMGWKSKLFAV